MNQTEERSGWSVQRTLAAVGISRGSYDRWLREQAWAREKEELTSRIEAEGALGLIIDWYNYTRLHSSLGYLRPRDYYRGDPQARRQKLAAARHRRWEKNMEL